ncbi:uncharacterized protein Tco025E_01822 [Trypanosoma conorhini]|uniref:Uncharacterized protein n=1 Tax=Trypanosoma conorhini TaxID=83891 RepID=A0A3R7LD20_9TRYP|nr:uncharacterized protein Tco025E_01822 [Trypanosoma conorhini]RNF25936.1 hypothetical protein Tco025E_01822 [Trypanosoma conorhini]
MWRLSLLRRVAAVGGRAQPSSSAPRPYHRVLKMLQVEGEGLPAAGGVFEQFRAFYRQTMAGKAASGAPARPIEAFCGAVEDVEPFALVMMKVLCDLQKMEELRFLFAQCVLELHSPSIELFNVYLLAISLTDTFNQYEIENVVEVMRAKSVSPDVVTRLSLFILYMRLGQDYSVWWPEIRDEALSIAKAERRGQYPLLELRLQHCFQTMLRLHHDVTMIQECFELLKLLDRQRLSSRLLLPYMLLSANNAAAPPATTVQLIELLEVTWKLEASTPEVTSSRSTSAVTEVETVSVDSTDPVLNNELTALKLMAKCAKWGDVASAAYLREYLGKHPGIVSAENQVAVSLLFLEAASRGKRLKEALTVLEDEVPETHCQPGPRPKFFLESRKVTLLNADPIMTLVRLVALGGASVEEGLAILEERREAGGEVSHKSLNVLMEAAALLKDEGKASMVFAAFERLGAQRTSRTFLLLLLSLPDAASSVARLPGVLVEMSDLGLELSRDFLRGGLALAIDAQDVSAAMQMVGYHERKLPLHRE